jgi:large subunit ribosomal protein L25
MFNLDVEGQEKNVILKEIQYGTYLHEVVHADFIAVTENTVVTVSVPVELKGEAKGSKEGGVVDLDLHEISVSCKVKDMVDNIEVDVTDLELNGVIHVSDIPAIPGIKILSPADNAVATCHMHTVEVEPAEGEEGDEAQEPEVIGEKKDEEGE